MGLDPDLDAFLDRVEVGFSNATPPLYELPPVKAREQYCLPWQPVGLKGNRLQKRHFFASILQVRQAAGTRQFWNRERQRAQHPLLRY